MDFKSNWFQIPCVLVSIIWNWKGEVNWIDDFVEVASDLSR